MFRKLLNNDINFYCVRYCLNYLHDVIIIFTNFIVFAWQIR